jgi:hypothetical protein
VTAVLDVGAADAFLVAQELWTTEDREYTEAQIRYAGAKLGVGAAEKAQTGEEAIAQAHGELLTDPAEVLVEVAKVMPRVFVEQMPRLGRRPKDHELSDELEALLADAPEHIAVTICDIDVFAGSATFTLYDEANDVDRTVGPIDFRRYESGRELWHAFDVLLGRLPKVLAADHN